MPRQAPRISLRFALSLPEGFRNLCAYFSSLPRSAGMGSPVPLRTALFF